MLEDEQKEVMERLEYERKTKQKLEKIIEECEKILISVNNRIDLYEKLLQLGEICDLLEGICDSM